MPGTADVLSPGGEGGRAMLPRALRETPRPARRVLTTDGLIAPPCELVDCRNESVTSHESRTLQSRFIYAHQNSLCLR